MTEFLRIVAIDDEPLALRRIELLVERIPHVELAGKADNGPAGLELIRSLRPDVVLLDIKMAGMSGLDLIEHLPADYPPLIIFVTAFDQFAPKAFDIGAADYVLKPLELGRLSAALTRARRSLAAIDSEHRIEELRQVIADLRSHTAASSAKRYETELWAERRGEFVRVFVEDLNWVSAERDYVRLHTSTQSFLLRETTSNLEARLDPNEFIRVRRSALVRLDQVSGIRKAGYGDFRVRLNDGTEVRVGRTYITRIRRMIAPRMANGDDLADE